MARIRSSGAASGSGNVSAAANITDNAIVRGNGGAKGVQGSVVYVEDSGEVNGVTYLEVNGTAGVGHVTGSDEDMTLSTVGVTGFPEWSWDESEDRFSYNKGINITAGYLKLGSTVAFDGVLDEDAMTSNSATKLATQQSIKAYSDSGTQTMTNKTLTSPVITVDDDEFTLVKNTVSTAKVVFSLTNISSSTTRTVTFQDANGTVAYLSDLTESVPTGYIAMWPSATAPTGYLLCDGTAVSRTTYADLFAEIAGLFGAGDGSTTFNVPDFRQRHPLGKAASGTGSTLGGWGGNIDHIHDQAHGWDSGNTAYHVFRDPAYGSYVATAERHATGIGGYGNGAYRSAYTSTGNAPFLAVNFIIKT